MSLLIMLRCRAKIRLFATVLALFGAFNCYAVVDIKPPANTSNWLLRWQDLTFNLYLPLFDEVEVVSAPLSKIKARIVKAASDETIEPIYLDVVNDEGFLRETVKKFGKKSKEEELYRYLRASLQGEQASNGIITTTLSNNKKLHKVPVTKQVFRLLDKDELVGKFKGDHHKLVLLTEPLREDKATLREFLHELDPFFSTSEQQDIERRVHDRRQVNVDEELLPEFGRKMVKKFVMHRGPNCFHASLAFQSSLLTRSTYFNVKREKGYHRAMINYDELWRILQSNFYEVNTAAGAIKYGDILVFFDRAEAEAAAPINFRWIRHTATYLFNGYTFSKGSKSPNTPYTVKTLQEEWQTWQRYTKNMAVKIFRLSSKNVRKRPPQDLIDWIY